MEKQQETINDKSSVSSSITISDETYSHISDNELTLHNNNLRKNDKQIVDQSSVNSGLSEKMTEDPKDPKHWPKKKKNFILFIISAAGMIANLSSTCVNMIFL